MYGLSKILMLTMLATNCVPLNLDIVDSSLRLENIKGIENSIVEVKNDSEYLATENIINEYINYSNQYMGFEMDILPNMTIDNSLNGLVSKMQNDDMTINVFYDDFTNNIANYTDYITYSDNFLEDTKNNYIIEDYMTKIDKKKTHISAWQRTKLSKLANDKNYYLSAEINASKNKVYTILIKTTNSDLEMAKHIINSFKVTGDCCRLKIEDSYFKKLDLKRDRKTLAIYNSYFDNRDAEMHWGIFEPSAPENLDKLNKLEEEIGYDFKFLVRYQGFGAAFPKEEIIKAYENNKVIELSLQTSSPDEIYAVLDGRYDAYLNNYAYDIKAVKAPILFRLANEMNGDWCSYCSYHYSKDAELYVEFWKYIYNIFEKNGVKNVLWVWNPNSVSFPDFAWNNYLLYYPGDEYVDIVGLTAYNTGTYYDDEKWSTFNELYSQVYSEYSRIFEKPLMITEFGCSTYGGDKVEWVRDMFSQLDKYPKIKVAIWWSGVDYDSDMNEARIYFIDRPKEALEVFRENIGVDVN